MVRVGTVVRSLTLCGVALTTLAFAQTSSNKTTVTYPSGFAVSRPLLELPIDNSLFSTREMPEPRSIPHAAPALAAGVQEDTMLQKENGPVSSATPGVDFDGIPAQNYAPSDANMAVGPNHIVETVNVRFAVYSKTGVILAGPTNITTLFSALGGNNNCAMGSSDPIVNYDRLADRWVISDIGYTGSAPYLECVAVSKTNDPTGAYFLYGYSFSSNLNDYPKLGVWPTATNAAYLATYNMFQNGSNFIGANLCGFDRTKMLAGNATAAQICKLTLNSEGGYLPSDMDGPTAPTDGTPGVFISWQNSSPGQLFLRKLTLNFAAGTATLSGATAIGVANFTQACGSCVPQLGTTQTLDTLSDRVMYRFAVRHFADHDRAVVNHAVQTGLGSQVAVRWYELYDPAGAVTVNQQGTFAPDSTYRWMASMAEDKNGDIGLGYSASSLTINPGIRFTGRVPTDPAGALETEASILTGPGSQTLGLSRWGDYTAMQVDPSDDCTFWYVDQYEKVSGTFNWNTNIGSFAFSGCTGAGGGGPAVTLTPTAVTFAKTVVNFTSPARAVTLANTGTATLNITNIAVSGDFSLATSTKPCRSTLAAGLSCVIKVTFTPTQLGTRTGTLTITDNAANSPQTVALTGTGAPPVALTPTSATFASQVVGTTSVAKVFTLTNNLSSAINSIVRSTTGDFSESSTTCTTTLAAKTKCTISVVFKPTATGTRPGTLTVTDSPTNSPQSSTLKGTGK